ncbi:MAG TPA: hypothetical protein VHP33_26565 [Polyangiaceae bacterium]|nr:hypothetical protein [Polyangiaceae bacterium]
MSGHGDPHEAHGEGQEHDEHDDDHHAPPALEEPATPLWLTLLGLGLFLLAGIVFVITREDGKTSAELAAVPAGEAAASAAAAPAPAPAPNPAAAPNPGNVPVRLNAPPNPPGTPSAARPGARPQRPGHEGHDHD